MAETAGAEVSAASVDITNLNRSSRNERPMVSMSPMRSAAIKAPFMEPMPPTMITTKAVMMISLPMPMEASVMGAISMPARPASTAPKAKTAVNSVWISIPNAPTMVRLEAPARISMPSLVWFTSQ